MKLAKSVCYLVAGLAVFGVDLGPALAQVTTKSGKQLLRYRWASGKVLHYSMNTSSVQKDGKTFTSAKTIDVHVASVDRGIATVLVREGCVNGVCTPSFDTLSIDRRGVVSESSPSSNLPFFQLPEKPVSPGDRWQGVQKLADGKVVLDSQFHYVGLRRLGNRTVAQVDDQFSLFTHGRKTGGTWTIFFDLSDGMVWRSSLRNEATVNWQRS